MIERDEDGFYAACDNCSSEKEIHQRSFERAVEVLKIFGWKVVRIKGKYYNLCPGCDVAAFVKKENAN